MYLFWSETHLLNRSGSQPLQRTPRAEGYSAQVLESSPTDDLSLGGDGLDAL